MTGLRIAIAVAILILSAARPGTGLRAHARARKPAPIPVLPQPAIAERADSIERNAECVGCHPAIAASWLGSLHQRSFSDSDFASAFAREPSTFCRSCHAPEAAPDRGTDTDALTELGVSCVTCHAPRGLSANTVLAALANDGRSEAPHEVQRTAAFSSPAACGSCHQFAFPDAPRRLMQATVLEHRRSPAADTTCVDCHMPRRAELGDARDHGFSASRDPAMLRAAVEIEAERTGPESVRIRLSAAQLGHAFPTGDMFRRVVVGARAFDGGSPLQGAGEVLGRNFTDGHRLEDDRRLGAGGDFSPRDVVLALPGAAGLPVQWIVTYERADMATHADDEPRVFESIELADGWL